MLFHSTLSLGPHLSQKIADQNLLIMLPPQSDARRPWSFTASSIDARQEKLAEKRARIAEALVRRLSRSLL
jgi:hypothetical protein